MSEQVLLVDFFKIIETDPRINSRHVSLYVSLLQFWIYTARDSHLELYSREVMCLCKISSNSTYHKTIRELHEYGYIIYEPSFNHHKRSRILLPKIEKQEKKQGN